MLLGTASAALQKPLLASKLGASVVGGGYGSSLQQAAFSVGLKGVAVGAEAKSAVVELIMSTLRELGTSGFDDAAVAASMNTVEFRLRASTASPMKGLSFMMGAM
jgi:Zn-dependent M16 (insulinase) family peptidase